MAENYTSVGDFDKAAAYVRYYIRSYSITINVRPYIRLSICQVYGEKRFPRPLIKINVYVESSHIWPSIILILQKA